MALESDVRCCCEKLFIILAPRRPRQFPEKPSLSLQLRRFIVVGVKHVLILVPNSPINQMIRQRQILLPTPTAQINLYQNNSPWHYCDSLELPPRRMVTAGFARLADQIRPQNVCHSIADMSIHAGVIWWDSTSNTESIISFAMSRWTASFDITPPAQSSFLGGEFKDVAECCFNLIL